MWFEKNPKSRREDPTELARPSGVVTTGTTGASAETESGTEGGEAPVAEKEALHAKEKREKEAEAPVVPVATTPLGLTSSVGSSLRLLGFFLNHIHAHLWASRC